MPEATGEAGFVSARVNMNMRNSEKSSWGLLVGSPTPGGEVGIINLVEWTKGQSWCQLRGLVPYGLPIVGLYIKDTIPMVK